MECESTLFLFLTLPFQSYLLSWSNNTKTITSVHCIFCDGYERRGGHVGVLGLNSPHDLDSALLAFPLARSGMTIFTGGKFATADKDTKRRFDIVISRGAKIDDRTIKSISENPDGVGLRLQFYEGKDKNLRILLSSPPHVNRARILIKSLGLETHEGAEGHVLSKSAMGGTSLRGCFVAGDTSTASKIVSVALASGTFTSYRLYFGLI